jgi:O-antigen/teichoic acid export membrane protein
MKAFYFDLSFQLNRSIRTMVAVVALAAVTNFLLNLWWIPRLGRLGAGYATVTAYAVGLGLSWYLGHRTFPLPVPWGEWARIAAATLGTAAVVLLARGPSGIGGFLLRAGLGGFVYLVLLLVFNVSGSRQWLAERRRGSAG